MAFPLDPLPLTTELFIGGGVGWVDIAEDVRLSSASSGGGVSITRGRSAEGTRADPGRLTLTLDNRSGRYSPRNPRGEWFGLFGRNTPIRVGVDLAADSFTRTVGAGWGSTEDGRPWTRSGGTAADFTVDGSQAKHLHPTGGIVRSTSLDRDWLDVEQVTEASIPAVATGASIVVGHVARLQVGAGHYYWLRMEFDVAGKLSAKISKYTGAWTDLAAASSIPGLTYTAGQSYTLRSSVVGSRLSVRIWPTGTVEPIDWTLTVVDRSIAAAGRAGLASWVVGGNTNTNPEVRFDNYRAINRRFFGEVAAWPVKWDVGGFDRWVPVEASGILRRLNQGTKSSDSALWRAYANASPPPVAWWPLEDGRSVGRVASGLSGGPEITELGRESEDTQIGVGDYDGRIVWGVEGGQGAASLAGLKTGGRLHGRIPSSSETSWTFEFVARYDAGTADGTISFPMTLWSGGRWEWTFMVNPNGTIMLAGGSVDGSVVGVNLSGAYPGWDGNLHHIRLDVEQSGANSLHYLRVDGVSVASGTWSGFLAPVPDVVLPNYYLDSGDYAPSIGHLALFAPHAPYGDTTRPAATRAWAGELAPDRIKRLCAEQGIPVAVTGEASGATAMGEQRPGGFLDLIEECAEADLGILFEQREGLGLIYRPRRTLYNQTPVALSYEHLSPPFDPVDDDDATRNDVTVTRVGSKSYRVIKSEGPLSALPPPVGVGRYDTSVELNLASDDQLPDQAGWRLHLGTVDEARYPTISANFASHALRDNPGLAARMHALDSGDVLSVSDLPDWLPPGPVKVMVQGYTETLDAFAWDITWNGTPGSVWDVGVVGQTRAASIEGATRLAAPIGAGDTSMLLSASQHNGPWTTNPAHFPQDLLVGGELVTVSAIGPAVSDPFTRTVSGGWGSEPGGLAYVNSGGTSANYSANGNRGQISLEAILAARGVNLPIGVSDVELLVGACGVSVAPTGTAYVEQGFRLRQSTPTRFVDLRLFRRPATNDVTFALRQYVDGAEVVTAFPVVPGASAGSSISVRLWAQGTKLWGKAWVTGQQERDGWDLELNVTHVEPGDLNVRASLAAGVTNTLPYLTFYDDLLISRPQKAAISARAVNGVARGWPAGTEVQIADRRVIAL